MQLVVLTFVITDASPAVMVWTLFALRFVEGDRGSLFCYDFNLYFFCLFQFERFGGKIYLFKPMAYAFLQLYTCCQRWSIFCWRFGMLLLMTSFVILFTDFTLFMSYFNCVWGLGALASPYILSLQSFLQIVFCQIIWGTNSRIR